MIKNWQHICIFSRIAGSDDLDIHNKTVYHDGKHIKFVEYGRDTDNDADYRMECIDVDTGEILLTIGCDGHPTYVSEWAKSEPSMPYQFA